MNKSSKMKKTSKLENLMNMPSTQSSLCASLLLTIISPEHSLPECQYLTVKTQTQSITIMTPASQNRLTNSRLSQLSLYSKKRPTMPSENQVQLIKNAAWKKNRNLTATSTVFGSYGSSASTNGIREPIKSSQLLTTQESGSMSKPKVKTANRQVHKPAVKIVRIGNSKSSSSSESPNELCDCCSDDSSSSLNSVDMFQVLLVSMCFASYLN